MNKMEVSLNNGVKQVSYSFPVFTAAALVLLILKFTAYPAISWWLIFGVWLAPFLIGLTFLGIIFGIFIIAAIFVTIVCSIVALFGK